MNINEKVLQDVLENTSLNEDEVNYQFNSILTSFENEETPHNQLYLYLKEHYPLYLNTLYNIKIPSYKRPEPVKPQPTDQDFYNLLATDVLLNSTINTTENSPTQEFISESNPEYVVEPSKDTGSVEVNNDTDSLKVPEVSTISNDSPSVNADFSISAPSPTPSTYDSPPSVSNDTYSTSSDPSPTSFD